MGFPSFPRQKFYVKIVFHKKIFSGRTNSSSPKQTGFSKSVLKLSLVLRSAISENSSRSATRITLSVLFFTSLIVISSKSVNVTLYRVWAPSLNSTHILVKIQRRFKPSVRKLGLKFTVPFTPKFAGTHTPKILIGIATASLRSPNTPI